MPHVDTGGDPRPKRRPAVTSLGAFGKPGGFANSPGMGPNGPVEVAAELGKRGWWAVLNAFDSTVDDDDWTAIWTKELDRRSVTWGWWARCYTEKDVKRLALLTAGYRRPLVIFNCETELVTGSVTEPYLRATCAELAAAGVECGLSTESPLYHSVDWQALAPHMVVLPQAFANEHPTKTAQGAYAEARARGVRVNATVGVYPVAGRERMTVRDYRPLPPAWSVYLLDNLDSWEGV